MIKYFFSITLLSACLGLNAQTKKPVVKKTSVTTAQKTVKPAAPVPVLKNLADSASYAVGMRIAEGIKSDMKDLSPNVFMLAIKSVLEDKTRLLESSQIDDIMMTYSQKDQKEMAKVEIEKGEAFFATNKKNPNVHTTASGLQYIVEREGAGIKPGPNDTVVCHYKGTLLNGTPFDASYDRGEPLTVTPKRVIKGWTEGLQLMGVGSKYKFFIPYQLAYGLRGAGEVIPPGAALIFEVELLDVKKAD